MGGGLLGACLIASVLVAAAPVARGAPATAAAPAAAASGFTPVSPVRVLDTRTAGGKPGAGATVTVDLAGRVPATTTAVVLNVTGVEATANTYVTAHPAGTARPTASNLNLVAGQVRPNLVTVAVGTDRKVSLFNQAGSVHLVADLTGHYATDATGRFSPLTPHRVFDSRTHTGQGQIKKVQPNSTVTLDLSDRVPRSATAVTFTLTGTEGSAPTYVTAWPAGTARPTASNLNLTAGETAPNLVTVALGADRKVNLYNFNGTVDLVVDLSGFYTPDFGSKFTPVPPTRVLDTRDGTGGVTGPLPGNHESNQTTLVLPGLPARTTGVVVNVTGTAATVGTFVTAWPNGEFRPTASTLNLVAGETAANLAAVQVGEGGALALYNFSGTVHVIADVAGYFTLPEFTCAAGCVYSWGSNRWGQLGTGGHERTSATPLPVYGIQGAVQVGAGHALLGDGTVWAWGINGGGELGNGWSGSHSTIPLPVRGLADVVSVSDGLALKADGTVWAWGRASNSPGHEGVQVQGLQGVAQVTGGSGVFYALKSDGTVWSWGHNGFGALGTGSDTPSYTATPVRVAGLTGVTKVEAGTAGALAVRADGTVWSWGDNRQGQLGQGTVGGDPCYYTENAVDCHSSTPAPVVGLSGVRDVSADSGHGYAVLGDGTVWAWGSSYQGSLGNGSECASCPTGTPVRVSDLTTALTVHAGEQTAFAQDENQRLWGWGDNLESRLGPVTLPPNADHSSVPLLLSGPANATQLVSSGHATYALVP